MAASKMVLDKKRTVHLIKLKPEQVKATMLDHETVIMLTAGDRHFEAMVPTMSLVDGGRFVPAEQIGRRGDELVIVLPTGNDGTTKWYITSDELNEITL